MHLNFIELKGFGSYKDKVYKKFPDGITGIIGTYETSDRKSNGSGKTTFVESILYALFGNGEYDVIDDLVNDSIEDGNMYVRLNFTLPNGNVYELERGRKKTSSYLDFYEILQNDEKNRVGDDSTSIKKTQQHIVDILGMDYDMFSASIFFEQGKMDKFVNTEPSVRRGYVDKILDIIKWRDSGSKINTKINKIKSDIIGINDEISEIENTISELNSSIQDKSILEKEIEDNTKKKNELTNKLDEYNKYKNIRVRLDFLNQSKEKVKSNIDNIDIKISSKENELSNLTVEEDDINFNEFIQNLNSNLESLFKESENDKIKNKELDTNLNNITQNITEKTTLMSVKKGQLISIDSDICPNCHQKVTSEHIKYENDKINKDVSNLLNEINTLTSTKNDCIKEKNNIETRINNTDSKIKDIKKEIEELELKKHNQELKKLSFEKDKKSLQESIDDLNNTKTQHIQEIESIDKEISDNKVNLPEGVEEVNVTEVNATIQDIDTTLNYLTKDLGRLEQVEKDIKKNEELLLRFKNDLKKNEEILYFHTISKEILKIIPENIFKESIIDIENISNSIIQQLLPDLSVNIYEDNSKKARPLVIDFNYKNKKRSYKRLSGGERVVVNVALRLGFSRVITHRMDSHIGFIILDEPFGSLDEENRYLIKKVFAIISEYFKQIFVISHDESIENFPNIIKVRKTIDDISYIE